MGGSSPKAPEAPDPRVVASAQTQQNKDTAIYNAALNRVNQVTPWGNLTYTQNGVDANGIPQYTQTISLSPDQQKLMQNDTALSQGLSDLGLSQLGNAKNAMGQPFNYNGAPQQALGVNYGSIQNDVDMRGVPKLIGGDKLAEDLNTQRDALYRQQTAFLDPQWKQDQSDLENKLISQGIAQNSDAWNRAVGDFSRNKEFAYGNARNTSITGGGAEQSRLFNIGLASNQNAYGQALNNAQFHNAAQAQGFGQAFANAGLQNQGRAQYINEQNYLRQQPLNELNALRSGSQINVPQFTGVPQSVIGNTDMTNAMNNQYQSQLAAYNGQISSNNANKGALTSLGTAAVTAMMMY